MQPELPGFSQQSPAGDDRSALLRFHLKAAKRQAFCSFCGSLEACLEVGDFELDQSAQCVARSKPGWNSNLAAAASGGV
jgi:hypothetical protein